MLEKILNEVMIIKKKLIRIEERQDESEKREISSKSKEKSSFENNIEREIKQLRKESEDTFENMTRQQKGEREKMSRYNDEFPARDLRFSDNQRRNFSRGTEMRTGNEEQERTLRDNRNGGEGTG